MTSIPPSAEQFRTTVLGTVFGQRMKVVHRLHAGDRLILVPDAPGIDDPNVWVHAPGGDVVGHLAPDVGAWLAPWMLEGGRCGASVEKVKSDDVESWRRVVIVVKCRMEASTELPVRGHSRSASARFRPS